jgi:hypothetical protein
MPLIPSFVYRVLESRMGRYLAYAILFAAIFVFIVMYLFHLEN